MTLGRYTGDQKVEGGHGKSFVTGYDDEKYSAIRLLSGQWKCVAGTVTETVTVMEYYYREEAFEV